MTQVISGKLIIGIPIEIQWVKVFFDPKPYFTAEKRKITDFSDSILGDPGLSLSVKFKVAFTLPPATVSVQISGCLGRSYTRGLSIMVATARSALTGPAERPWST